MPERYFRIVDTARILTLLSVLCAYAIPAVGESVEQKAVVYVPVDDRSRNTRIAVIDLETRQILKYIPIGYHAAGANMRRSPDGKYVYFPGYRANKIFVINALTDVVEDSLSVQRPSYIGVTPDDRFIYSINNKDLILSVIDISARNVVKEIAIDGKAYSVPITPDGHYAYIPGDSIFVLDIPMLEIIKKIDVNRYAGRMAWCERKGLLYAINSDTTIAVVDSSSQSMIRQIRAPIDKEEDPNSRLSEIIFGPCEERMFLRAQGPSFLMTVETEEVMGTVTLPSYINQAQFTPDGAHIYASTSVRIHIEGERPPKPGRVFILSAENARVIGEIDVGFAPMGIQMVTYPLPVPGDFSGDLQVDFDDFFLFARAYGTRRGSPEWRCVYDLNRDGKVNFSDFLRFAQLFMGR